MTPSQLKEANRLFWIVKGHLIPSGWSEHDIASMQDSYLRRIWGNHEAVFHEDGFESAWQAKISREN
jgi:hypothetical protein